MLIKPQSTSSLPLNWDAIFPEKNPLAVEIGFGNGKFLKTLETIGANVVGFEVSLLSVEKAMKVIDHTKNCAAAYGRYLGPQRAVFGKKRRRIVHQLSLTLASQETCIKETFYITKTTDIRLTPCGQRDLAASDRRERIRRRIY